jgi:DNA polymerase
MSTFHLDYETRSNQRLVGKGSVGAFRYAYDPSCAILCAAIAKDDQEPRIWRFEDTSGPAYEWLQEMVEDPESLVYAHNAMFEIAVSGSRFRDTFGLPAPQHHQWRCTMAMARRAGLPASLEKCAEALNLENKKDKRGKDLINKFSVPQPKDSKKLGKKAGEFVQPWEAPEDFEAFCQYCIQDVRVERDIHKKLSAFELKGFSLRTYQLDVDINTRGFPVNLEALNRATKVIEQSKEELKVAFRNLTGFNPTQRDRVLEWLQTNGFKGNNLRAETMDEFFEEEEFDNSTLLGKALNLRKQASFASLAKIPAMIACAGPHDNRVRGTLNYHGAGTGRWTANLVQPQNFKKPSKHLEKVTASIYEDLLQGASGADLSLCYSPPLECISSAIRHFIHDLEGPFFDADYSAIEARIIAWQAQEKWRIDFLGKDGRIYEASASKMFGTPMVDFEVHKQKHGSNHPLRAKGKITELACGFMGWVDALIKSGALREGLTREELPELITAWRDANPAIVKFWEDIERAAKAAIRGNGRYPFGVRCEMFCAETAGIRFLFMRLPSGRKIAYPWPKIEKMLRWKVTNPSTGEKVGKRIINPTPEDLQKARETDPKAKITETISYWGNIKDNQWGRIATYAGSLTNNCVQGIAADIMAVGANNAKEAGYKIVALIHDQAIAQYDCSKSIEEFIELLTDMPEWADGLPLKADGGVIPFYRKD